MKILSNQIGANLDPTLHVPTRFWVNLTFRFTRILTFVTKVAVMVQLERKAATVAKDADIQAEQPAKKRANKRESVTAAEDAEIPQEQPAPKKAKRTLDRNSR